MKGISVVLAGLSFVALSLPAAAPGAELQTPGKLGSLQSLGSMNELFAKGNAPTQGTPHPGGINVLMGDGSVRNAPPGGNDTIWIDIGAPVGASGSSGKPVSPIATPAARNDGLALRSLETQRAGASATYQNPKTFQIISAGQDGAGKRVDPGAGPKLTSPPAVQPYNEGGVTGFTRKVIGVTK